MMGNKHGLGKIKSAEAREKDRQWHLGRKLSQETKDKISKNRKGKISGENHPNWKGGRKITKKCKKCGIKFVSWIYQKRKYCSKKCGIKQKFGKKKSCMERGSC